MVHEPSSTFTRLKFASPVASACHSKRAVTSSTNNIALMIACTASLHNLQSVLLKAGFLSAACTWHKQKLRSTIRQKIGQFVICMALPLFICLYSGEIVELNVEIWVFSSPEKLLKYSICFMISVSVSFITSHGLGLNLFQSCSSCSVYL